MSSGHNRYNSGKSFENDFDFACVRQGWFSLPIPSGAKWISKFKIIPIKSPFDRVITFRDKTKPLAGYFDLKSHSGKSFSHSLIKQHQVESLFQLHLCGHTAGYLVWFSASDEVIFFNAEILQNLKTRQSLGPEEGVSLGNLENFVIRKAFSDLSC